jgi:hypothetical protein
VIPGSEASVTALELPAAAGWRGGSPQRLASRGRGGEFRIDRPSTASATTAPEPGPWFWPSQERGIAPSVPRGLHTYVYGVDYARQVRDSGFRVSHVSGKLYRFECSSAEPIREPATSR